MQDERQLPTPPRLPRSRTMTWLALALALTVFLLDLLWLHGRGEAALYVIVVLIFLWSTHWRYVLAMAAVCSVLTLIGFVFASAEPPPEGYLANHIFSFLVIWLTAILGYRMNHLSDQLAASEARTRAIVESAAEGIITINEQGTVESINASATDIFGYEDAEIVGQPLRLLLPADKRDPFVQGLSEYLKSGEKHVIGSTREVRGMRKDGTTFPMLIAVSEIHLEERLFVGIVLDMTDLYLAQSRVVQNQRLAAIGEAMTGLAHESRNALQRSQAALEMLARIVGEQASATDLIGRIQDAQDDLHQLYEEVRGYAAPLKLQTETCEVDALLQKVWEKMSPTRAGRDAELVQIKREPNLACEVDPFATQRIFRNILENSLEAVQDPVRISVSYSHVTHEGRPAIEISLHDNGPGLDEAARRKLFEPFFTTKSSGTGLGMSIARRYVEAHGGVIEVTEDSAPGANFRILLPRTQP